MLDGLQRTMVATLRSPRWMGGTFLATGAVVSWLMGPRDLGLESLAVVLCVGPILGAFGLAVAYHLDRVLPRPPPPFADLPLGEWGEAFDPPLPPAAPRAVADAPRPVREARPRRHARPWAGIAFASGLSVAALTLAVLLAWPAAPAGAGPLPPEEPRSMPATMASGDEPVVDEAGLLVGVRLNPRIDPGDGAPRLLLAVQGLGADHRTHRFAADVHLDVRTPGGERVVREFRLDLDGFTHDLRHRTHHPVVLEDLPIAQPGPYVLQARVTTAEGEVVFVVDDLVLHRS